MFKKDLHVVKKSITIRTRLDDIVLEEGILRFDKFKYAPDSQDKTAGLSVDCMKDMLVANSRNH